MKNIIRIFFVLTVFVCLLEYLAVSGNRLLALYDNTAGYLAGVFFLPSITETQLHSTYASAATTTRKVRILLVPGHEPSLGGGEYKSAVERDIVLNMGKEINKLFSRDQRYEVVLARDDSGWQLDLLEYFTSNEDAILNWRNAKENEMNRFIEEGLVRSVKGVSHVNAPSLAALHLYGINKWASENSFDIVVHLHVNDYPRKNISITGKYKGIAIYIPEAQYSNAAASKALAETIGERLLKILPKSTLPEEAEGIVPDQDLIAIGRFNTSDTASLLIEYGYIYEPMYRTEETRNFIVKELAYQTALGIKNYFEREAKIKDKYKTDRASLPYIWKEQIRENSESSRDILALQVALASTGLYHQNDISSTKCQLTGFFGSCTKLALINFQKKLDIQEQGVFGEETRAIFNRMFGPQGDGVIRTDDAQG